jgi:hypothetical protein
MMKRDSETAATHRPCDKGICDIPGIKIELAELQRGSRLAFQCLGDRQRHHNGLQVGKFRVRFKGYT